MGASIKSNKINAKVMVVKIQKLPLFSAFLGSIKSKINNKTMAKTFFKIAWIGVIGNKLPKQPQLPEFPPLIKLSMVKCVVNTASNKMVEGITNFRKKLF
jgi:hypothetical protein